MNEKDVNSVLWFYRQTVRTLLEKGDTDMIPNSSKDHASIILQEMLKFARTSFRAYSGGLARDVWNDGVLDEIVAAANRGVDVRIVVAKGSADGIREDVRRFVTCVPASLDAGMREKIESVDHFSVADARAIRIENDRAARKAVFCANNPAVADLLAKTHKAIARTIEAA
ncbi:MAG: hypothetical protein PUE68_03230 [Kiritimatiellae bacterium]|nr:hypothetical protein [Kiritimatiellia bacterium]